MEYKQGLLKILPLSLLLFPIFLQAQSPVVQALPFSDLNEDYKLTERFKAYQTYHISTNTLLDIVHNDSAVHRLTIDLPGYGVFALELFENPLQAPNYVVSVQHADNIERIPGSGIVKTFRGNLQGGQFVVSLTIDDNFVYGFIQLPKNDRLRIEPLNLYSDTAPADAIIVYRLSDELHTEEHGCEVREHHLQQVTPEPAESNDAQRVVGDCKTVQIAFADDWLMYDDHGQSITNVENHNMGVINDVQNNYDNEFADDLIFEVVEIWISTCSTCDPWTNSTNAGVLLDDFTDWGPSGFSNTHDVADLWTDRDFNGPTVGVSWLDAVCTPFRYLTTQDFTNNGGTLRALLAHELGHNFGSGHDPEGSQTIMAPTLVVTNVWSQSSINQINNYIGGINCLSLCTTVEAPVADFSADEVTGCSPLTVDFFDESTGPPTAWDWTFPGGIPSSSSQQNPTVNYPNPGTYDVILEVSNSAGTNTLVRTDFITVLADPLADFIYDQLDLTLIFTNLSEGADTYFWDFGDGSTSTQENPTHTYEQDGEYEISLTVTNECGDDNYTIFVEVYVPPTADFSYSTNYGCAPLVVQFLNESSDNVQYFEWLFPGGIPASSTQENPVVTYNNPGFYNVTLIVENIAGIDVLTVNNLIEVAPLPEADFNFAVNGMSVQFVNASIDADTYLWSFGDGATSSAESPNHTYGNGGTYQVTLTASNDCGSDIYTTTVVISSAPVANFITSVSTGCAPLTVTYTSTSLGLVTSYNWSFPGGTPASSTAEMPTVVYNTPGTYDAQLIVGNAIGFDTLLIEDVVTIYPDVVSGFIVDVNGATVNLTNTSLGASVYNWLIEGTTYIVQDLLYTFEEDGDYAIQLIAIGQCGSDTTVQIVHIATPPTAGFASSITSGCQPLIVQFFNTSSSNATTFAWVFEGGTPGTSSEENPVVQYAQPGTYDVHLTVWSEVGMDMIVTSDVITVDPLPVSLFSTVQMGLQIEFTNSSLMADQYLWLFGDGDNSIEENPVHTFGDFGTYPVTLISANACGTDTLTLNLTLSSAPVPMFSAGQINGCIPLEVQFIDMSQNGPELWEWSFPGGLPDTSNLQSPVVVYMTPGIYPVALRVSNVGGAQALVRDEYIHVAFPPVADFTADPNNDMVSFTNTSAGANSYFWSFGDGGFDTTANPMYVYAVNGTYQVQLIATNVCSADTVVHDVTVTVTAVDDPGAGVDIRVYPNPNTGVFTIQLSGSEEYELEIRDLLGREMLHTTLAANQSRRHNLNLQDAKSGVYSVIIRKGDFRYVVKMVVLQ